MRQKSLSPPCGVTSPSFIIASSPCPASQLLNLFLRPTIPSSVVLFTHSSTHSLLCESHLHCNSFPALILHLPSSSLITRFSARLSLLTPFTRFTPSPSVSLSLLSLTLCNFVFRSPAELESFCLLRTMKE